MTSFDRCDGSAIAKHKELEIAKIGVEQAIETNEATVTLWINEQLEALGLELT